MYEKISDVVKGRLKFSKRRYVILSEAHHVLEKPLSVLRKAPDLRRIMSVNNKARSDNVLSCWSGLIMINKKTPVLSPMKCGLSKQVGAASPAH